MARRPTVLALAACLGASLLAREAGAQTRIHRSWTVADGLVQSQVFSIAEDRQGFLWIGTAAGVSRFDGHTFESFLPGDGLPAGSVLAIYQVPGEDLFFGTDGGGAAVFRNGRFLPLPAASGLDHGRVTAIVPGPQGSVLFAHDHQVVKLRPDGRYEILPGQLPREAIILSLLASKDGRVFVGTQRHGAFVLQGGRVVPLEGRLGRVNVLREAGDGGIWLGAERGLFLYRGGALEHLFGQDEVYSILAGSDGTLYFGTHDSGLQRLPLGDPISKENGLPSPRVWTIHETSEGVLYLGTDLGLSAYDGGALESWTRPGGGDLRQVVFSVLEQGRDVWLGTGAGLAVLRDGNRWETPAEWKAAGGVTFRALHRGASGRLYAATEAGLWIENGRSLRRLGVREGLPSDFIRAVHEGLDGRVYIGTNKGLAVLREGKVETLPGGALAEAAIWAITGTADGALWFGTQRDGLARLDRDGSLRTWTERDGLAGSSVLSIRESRDGRLLLGTHKGLSVFHDGRFRNLGSRHGLSNETVYCALEDQQGHLYLLTNRGINILEPGAGEISRVLLREDGLPAEEGNLGACARGGDGRLWFGTVAGVSVYDPQKGRLRREPPRVHVTGWRLFGKGLPVSTVREPSFESRANYFSFSYTGIDLAQAGQVRYRHRLTGLDQDWSEPTDQRSVQYTNLDPGSYRFEVQAASQGGRWSRASALQFVIRSPRWWQQPKWTLSLSAFVLVAAGVSLSAYRVRQLLAVERLRAMLAADLHDDIGSGLTEIAILSDAAARRAGGAPSELTRVGETARQLVDRMDDIVWLVNPRRDSLHELAVRLKISYSELFQEAGVSFRTGDLAPLQDVRLPMPYRENLYAILKQALHNALRHSNSREVHLALALRGRLLEAVVRDDGQGFDPLGEVGGNGLGNMRRRAAAIGGRLEIESAPGLGTVVRFTGPVQRRKA